MASTTPSPARPEYLRLVALGALVGIPAGFAAALFLAVVHAVEHWLWHDLPDALGSSEPQWYLVVGLPVVGAAIVVAARRLLPGDGGHAPGGLPAPKVAPISHAPGILLAALGTLCFGAVLGPEGPIIALGAIVGLVVTAFARLAVLPRVLPNGSAADGRPVADRAVGSGGVVVDEPVGQCCGSGGT